MLRECRGLMAELPCTVKFHWMKGHQDDEDDDRPLDWWARQNIAMDLAAKRHWRLTKTRQTYNPIFPHEKFAILLHGQKLSSFNKEWVHERTNAQPIKTLWQTRHNLSDQQWDDIDWPAVKAARKEPPVGQNRFHAKLATGFLPHGRTMK